MTLRGWNDNWLPTFDALGRLRRSWPTRGWTWDSRLVCLTSSFTVEQEGQAKPVRHLDADAGTPNAHYSGTIFAACTIEKRQGITAAQAKNVDRMMRHTFRQIEILADCQWHRAMKAGRVHRVIIRVYLLDVRCLETAASWR